VIEMDIEKRIIEEIDKLRPFLQNDVGNIEYVKYEDGNVYVRLTGACAGCSMIDYTLKEGVEEILTSEIPEVKNVIKVE
jgi:Fe-S cluster biogenesis protein NfuA